MKKLFFALCLLLWGATAQAELLYEISPPNPRIGEQVKILISDSESKSIDGVTWQVQKPNSSRLPLTLSGGAAGPWSYTPRSAGKHTLIASVNGENIFIPISVSTALTLDDSIDRLTDDPYRSLQGTEIDTAKPAHLPTINADGDGANAIVRILKRLADLLIYAAGAIAVLLVVMAGLGLVESYGNPDGLAEAKRSMQGIVFGLLLMMVSYLIVKTVINFAFIGDTVADPKTETQECLGETASILNEIQASISEANRAKLQAQIDIDVIALWTDRAIDLQKNFTNKSWTSSWKDWETTESDLSKTVSSMQDRQTTAVTTYTSLANEIQSYQEQLSAAKASCITFKDPELMKSRAETLKSTVSSRNLLSDATNIKQKMQTDATDIINLFEKVVGGACKDDPTRSSGGILYYETSGDNSIRRYSCATDWDADGVSNEFDSNPLDPLN